MKPSPTKTAADSVEEEIRLPDAWWRELFAAAALGGLLARQHSAHTPEILAKLAYQYADAMIASPERSAQGE